MQKAKKDPDFTDTGETRKKGRNWVHQETNKLSIFCHENAETLDHELGSPGRKVGGKNTADAAKQLWDQVTNELNAYVTIHIIQFKKFLRYQELTFIRTRFYIYLQTQLPAT